MTFCLHLWLLYTRSIGAIFLVLSASVGEVKGFYSCQAANAIKRTSHKTDSLFVYQWQSHSIAFSAYAMCNEYVYTLWSYLNADGQSPLRHKQEKEMINEFDCALKPKAYTKIVPASMKSIIVNLLAVQLKENYFHQFQVRFLRGLNWPICTVILSDAFPWSQLSSQSIKTFLRSALTLIIFILVELATGYPHQFLTCHDHATLYSTTDSFKRLSLISTLNFELILSWKKARVSSRRVQAPRECIGKKGQGSGHWKWDVSQPFFFLF